MQSSGLAAKLTAIGGGRRLTTDSRPSEGSLTAAIRIVMQTAQKRLDAIKTGPLAGTKVSHQSTLSLYECQRRMHSMFPTEYPPPTESSVIRSMRPDGGIISVTVGERWHPLLITEDLKKGKKQI